MKKKHEMTASEFMALPDVEKNRIVAEIEAETPEQRLTRSRPMNAEERAWWKKFQAAAKREKRGPGRPKVGHGVQKVSVSIERSLLDRVDAFAKMHKMKRSELFAAGVLRVLGSGSTKRSA